LIQTAAGREGGVWQIPGATAGVISAVSASPVRGAGSGQQYTFTISDIKGSGDIGIVNILVNDFIDGREGCYLAYIVQAKLLVLVDDAGNAGALSSGRCRPETHGRWGTGNVP
jgi:hypothetical protein